MLAWGDVQLRQTSNGGEVLEHTERKTKTRTGENPRDVRQIKPKMFRFREVKESPHRVKWSVSASVLMRDS